MHPILIACVSLWLCLGYVQSQVVSVQNDTCVKANCSCCDVQCSGNSATSCVNCKDGFHGENCTYNCPIGCLKCVDAEVGLHVANCTQCKEGYYTPANKYQCEACSQECKTCLSHSYCTQCFGNSENLLLEKFCVRKTGILAPECLSPCKCCKMTCSTDISCGGNCIDGYHGGRCKNKCPKNCVRCVDTQQGGGESICTLCKNGFYSTSILFQCQQSCQSQCKTCEHSANCTSCRDGDYLTTSGQCVACPEACSTCNSSSHCIFCKDGHYLTTSDQCASCSEGCLHCSSASSCTSCRTGHYLAVEKCIGCSPLCSSCSSADSCICSIGCSSYPCNESTAICSFGCKENFANKKCDACIPGKYGYNCKRNCSETCMLACKRITGKCAACREGYFGDFCNQVCPANCTSSCDNATGNCDACKDGYYGNKCTLSCPTNCESCTMTDGTCITCTGGFYGDACIIKCPVNCLHDICEKTVGNCTGCEKGFKGNRCNIINNGIGTTIATGVVIAADLGQVTGPAVGGTLGGLVVIGILIAVIVHFKRSSTGEELGHIMIGNGMTFCHACTSTFVTRSRRFGLKIN